MTGGPGDTKARLLGAGERLFARDGIHRARLRELNALAGQRNSSALHYHFGSRRGLVDAILLAHQSAIDASLRSRLDELGAGTRPVAVRDLVEAVIRPLARELETASGRDFLRIVPQLLPAMSAGLRSGRPEPITPETGRLLALLDRAMEPLPTDVRRERLVAYALLLTSVLADRAHQVETGQPQVLDAEQFVAHLVDIVTAALTAPSTVAI
jgi:AcrR family transcriptional regulator